MTKDQMQPTKKDLLAAVGLGNAVTPDGENIIRMIRVGVWGGYQGYPELAYRAEVYAASVGKGGLLSFITTFHAN